MSRESPPARVIERVRARITVTASGCWLWQGALSTSGYGHIAWQKARVQTHRATHRVMYEAVVGPVPEGLDLDHLCRVRACCNPDHLEPVTRRENLLRGETVTATRAATTHCPQGHEYTVQNTNTDRLGRRSCAECTRAANRAYYWKNRERRKAYNRAWREGRTLT